MASRGLDIKNLPIVVNYDFPSNVQQYVHRIGRCGRQEGLKGLAVSFITRNYIWMAPTLIRLLRSCRQKVDPNLLKLAIESGQFDDDDDDDDEKSTQQHGRTKSNKPNAQHFPEKENQTDDGKESSDDNDFFPESDDDCGPKVTLSGKAIE